MRIRTVERDVRLPPAISPRWCVSVVWVGYYHYLLKEAVLVLGNVRCVGGDVWQYEDLPKIMYTETVIERSTRVRISRRHAV